MTYQWSANVMSYFISVLAEEKVVLMNNRKVGLDRVERSEKKAVVWMKYVIGKFSMPR